MYFIVTDVHMRIIANPTPTYLRRQMGSELSLADIASILGPGPDGGINPALRDMPGMKILGGSYYAEHELRRMGLRCGDNVRVHETAQLVNLDNMEFGSHVRIDPFCVLSAASGQLKIGSRVHIAVGTSVVANGPGVTFEDFSGTSHYCSIFAASDDFSGKVLTNPMNPKELLGLKTGHVRLGRHVIMGTGTTILPGCSIANGCAIMAHSLVTNPCEREWVIIGGNPAKPIANRDRTCLELEKKVSP
jgi:galactoside O-acetyltransferase